MGVFVRACVQARLTTVGVLSSVTNFFLALFAPLLVPVSIPWAPGGRIHYQGSLYQLLLL